MDEPIEDAYFNWLHSKVDSTDVPTPSLTHYTLLRVLHSIEFVWTVVGDDNRAEDGLDVRREFLRNVDLPEEQWTHMPCSVLELLIAFSRKAAFQTDISDREWFWIFLDNLNLAEMTDARNNVAERVYDRIEKFIWRLYRPNGRGGLFPLEHTERDQRKVELWYQFCEYVDERERS